MKRNRSQNGDGRLEGFFREGSIDSKMKACRYHLLMLLRYIVGGSEMPSLTANKIEKYCQKMLDVLVDDAKALDAFKSAAGLIQGATNDNFDRDTAKTQGFTDLVKKAGGW